ncbi:MAG: polyketide cyclase [Actinomycetota bacterium]
MATRYHLITRMRLGVDRGRTWETFIQVREWPSWWRWLDRVDVLREGDARGVGAVFRQRVTSPLRYGFTWQTEIVRVVDEALVELGSSGALEGTGRFVLTDLEGGETEVVFTWLVETTKLWMNVTAPLARPLFTWSHDRLMTDFGRGLAGAAGGRLLSVSHSALRPRDQGFFRMPEFEG